MEEVGTDAVILVDERDARNVEVAGLTPHGLGLRLHASNSVEHGNSAVEDAERTLDLGREVHVARGVDDLNTVGGTVLHVAALVPEARGGSGGDGHAALLLLDHPVHGGSTLVHLTDLVGLTGVVQMRSVVVVLPASMWAIMPMLRVSARLYFFSPLQFLQNYQR